MNSRTYLTPLWDVEHRTGGGREIEEDDNDEVGE
jgi:hypothetical protein